MSSRRLAEEHLALQQRRLAEALGEDLAGANARAASRSKAAGGGRRHRRAAALAAERERAAERKRAERRQAFERQVHELERKDGHDSSSSNVKLLSKSFKSERRANTQASRLLKLLQEAPNHRQLEAKRRRKRAVTTLTL